MDLEKLLDPFPAKKEAEYIAYQLSINPEYIPDLWQICISTKKHSWRAVWLLDKLHDIAPKLLRSYIPKMIALVPMLENESKLRHFLKIISLESLPNDLSGSFISRCFDLLISPNTSIAVQVHAMQILFNFSLSEPDIQNELKIIIQEKIPAASAGFRARAKRILKQLN